MATHKPNVFDDLQLDHVAFYVDSVDAARDWLVGGYGLAVRAASDAATETSGVRSVELGAHKIRLLFQEPLVDDHPGASYVERHGDGVSDIALGVPDTAAAFEEAVLRGARPVSSPMERDGIVTASIRGFGDVIHTFVQRPQGTHTPVVAGLTAGPRSAFRSDSHLTTLDHFAVCVAPGTIGATVDFYREVLDFDLTFDETLQIGSQAMTTKVVQSRTRTVTLTFIEPDSTQDRGHIDDFLEQHGGAGVQHIAFSTYDIVGAVDTLRARGVAFMGTPGTYYDDLPNRVVPTRYSVDELREREILVDEDHDGQLYQIFARSVHPRGTIFLELIERMGARTFGSGNIKALYQAAERQRGDQAPERGRDDLAA